MLERPQPIIVMTPPTVLGAPSVHPRRAPAHRSVSLLHTPREQTSRHGNRDSSGSSQLSRQPPILREKANNPSASLQPLGREGSGESSNADKWFDKSNNAVRDQSTSFVDNEPPFFMRHSSSSETSPDAQNQLKQYLEANNSTRSFGLRTGLMQLGTEASSTDDFRGVIDDLTIENKKLKRRLKRYEKLHDSHLKDEKLFEVRTHGLPAGKKRELEETLRKFAVSLEQKPGSEFPSNGYEGLLPMLKAHKPASSQANDSAYASMSMSASGQGGSSAHAGSDSKSNAFNPSVASRRQNIHSYLHHIPEGLLPQPNPATMTERARKKLVVKRLEQLFAGRDPADSGHQQPLQQQEVSQSAAHDDRSAMEAQGQRARKEVVRDALILPQDSDDSKQDSPAEVDVSRSASAMGGTSQKGFAERSPSQSTLYQRPIRPLDLDPHRAQSLSGNMAFFRHLGFSPPEPESNKTPEEGHGWIYLNLLINMAQLHTINVTVELVQKALSEYSDQFELSPDGRKVRWNGGRLISRVSSDSGEGSSGRSSDDPASSYGPRKRSKLSHNQTAQSSVRYARQAQREATPRSQAEYRKFVYTPMFSDRGAEDDEEDSSSAEEDDAASSPFPPPVTGNLSGMTSAGSRTAHSRKNKDDGPIIFYHNTRFCTNLSAERRPEGNRNARPYAKLAAHPLRRPRSSIDHPSEKRGPLAAAAKLPEPMDLGDNLIPESMELNFPDSSPFLSRMDSGKEPISRKPVDLEVTGMGGVWPADNFKMNLQSRHARISREIALQTPKHHLRSSLPPRFAHILHGQNSKGKTRAAEHKQIVAVRRKDLPSSELPPALGSMPFTEDSVEDDESEADAEMSITPESPGAFTRSPALLPIEIPSADSEDEDEDEDSDAKSDSSLDFLAAAREADPESIRAKEREYDAHMAEQLAEEIPAGSSDATAHGGSGFASPASVAGEEYQRAKQAARAAQAMRPALKRALTSDSMQVQGNEGSDEESDDRDAKMSMRP